MPALLTGMMSVGGLSPARAAEVTRVVSGFEDPRRFDINATVWWLHEMRSASVKREANGGLIRDLKFAQQRDLLNLRLDFGVFWDIGFHIEAPLVLNDTRSLDFDQGVSAANTTVLDRDKILPSISKTSYGLDATHGGRPFEDSSATVFRGPRRSGIESLGLGLTGALMNQARDDSKPTWTLSFDAKLDVGKDMRFDRANPGANTAVGLGYHQLIWSTYISKRFRYFDPYFGAWYALPVRTNGSPFQQYKGGNQSAVGPQQRAGLVIGFEQIAWEVPATSQRVTIEVRGHAEQHFFGRSHSELWEALSGSSRCTSDATQCRAGLDEDLNGDGRPDPYPGVTDTQPYATLGGDLGLNIQVGKHVRFRGLFGLSVDTPHFITYANAGVDRDNNGTVNSNLATEANPVYRELIDLPGRRFRVEGTEIWSLFLEGSVLF